MQSDSTILTSHKIIKKSNWNKYGPKDGEIQRLQTIDDLEANSY